MKFRRKIIVIGYGLAFLALFLFYQLQMHEYAGFQKIDIANAEDKTAEFQYGVDAPIDSTYIVISGYAYQTFMDYKTIDYKIVLLNKRTGETFSIKTQPVERQDLLKNDTALHFAKVGLYGRVSKKAGAFSQNYYEICYLITINNENSYVIHTGSYMGTAED